MSVTRHYGMFQFKDEITDEKINECFDTMMKMVGKIPGLLKIPVKRIGMVIKIRSEMIDEYKTLHVDTTLGVRDLLTKYNIRNFSIFLQELDSGQFYEFGYYEYTGNNFEIDMAKMEKEERIIE